MNLSCIQRLAVTVIPTVRELDNLSPVKEMVLTPGSDLDFYFPDASTSHKRNKALLGETSTTFEKKIILFCISSLP